LSVLDQQENESENSLCQSAQYERKGVQQACPRSIPQDEILEQSVSR
jgi:hypothetical protein